MALLTQKITLKMTPRNITHWRQKYAQELKIGQEIEVTLAELPRNAKNRVKAECDSCGSHHELIYEKYVKNTVRNEGHYHCRACSNIARKKTIERQYGVDNVAHLKEVQEKKKQTNLQKYGVGHSFQADSVRAKRAKTNLDRYGKEEHLSSDIIRDKINNTVQQRYGVDHYSKSDEFKASISEKWKEERLNIMLSYGADVVEQKEDGAFILRHGDHTYKTTLKNYYQRTQIYEINPCTKCSPLSKSWSEGERKLSMWIQSLGVIVENNKTGILPGRYELDIYCPEHGLAVEYNGFPWHCVPYKDPSYHLMKTEECLKKGIRLIHVWADEWMENEHLVKSNISGALGIGKKRVIYARKTRVVALDNSTAKQYLLENHMDGYVPSSARLGLVCNTSKELVQVMTFSKPRKALGQTAQEGHWELTRMASLHDTAVVGGAERLFQHFINTQAPKRITSYCHRYNRTGNVYNRMGMQLAKTTPPGYSYVKDRQRHNRYNFRKDVLVEKGWGTADQTEAEIMKSRGYSRLYDCGQQKWVWDNTMSE